MTDPIVLDGASPRSLGDLLKGYGIIAVLGERWPETRFWWDTGFHLVVSTDGLDDDAVISEIAMKLPAWAKCIESAFGPTRKKSCDKDLPCPDHPEAKKKGKKKGCPIVTQPRIESRLKSPSEHDIFDSLSAEAARAVAVPYGARTSAEPHPWFPGYGQEASGNYFLQLGAIGNDPKETDLDWSLFARVNDGVKESLDTGYLFFPDCMKRYATGVARWEQDKKSTVTAWCFMLALRGALLFRGTARRPRWRRSGYPAFPFVFEAGGVNEVEIPTWGEAHPRTLRELLLQIRGFHVPLAQGSLAVTAGEFSAAVRSRGPAVGFDSFHRFVLEKRRPSSREMLVQAIPRGLTRLEWAGADLREMVAPLGTSGWSDQFMLPYRKNDDDRDFLLEQRRTLDDAITAALNQPGIESCLALLESIWALNLKLLMSSKLRRILDEHGQTLIPAPPLPVRGWEQAFATAFDQRAEWRVARALGSIIGVQGDPGASVGPILEHMLPIQYEWTRQKWLCAKDSRPVSWIGHRPLQDFQSLLWHRWLDSGALPRLAFSGARAAPLHDVARTLRGELDIAEIHRLTPLFAILDWQQTGPVPNESAVGNSTRPAIPGEYAALRLWLELGIEPGDGKPPPRDGIVCQAVSSGKVAQIQDAVQRAAARLRVEGLPWPEPHPPAGKSVATLRPQIERTVAERLALALLIPISRSDTLALSRRLSVMGP